MSCHGRGLDLVGQALHEVRPGQRVDRVGDPGLVGQHLLGPQGQAGRGLARQGEGLVVGVGVQRLGAAEHRRQALHGHPDDVVERLLGGELDPGRLGVEAQHPRARLLGPEPGGHGVGPDAAGRPELGRLLEQGRAGHEEEGQPGRERVHGQAGVDSRLHIGDGVGQGEGDLLDGGRPRLGHVVAGDGDGVEAGQVLGAVGEQVGGDPQRRRRRVDVGAAGDVLLEHVVLDRAGERGRVSPCSSPTSW